MKECPHCFTRVLQKSDGTCPRCLKDMNDTRGTDPDRMLLVIPEQTRSPDLCCQCGLPTFRKVTVARNEDGTDSDYSGVGEVLKWILIVILAPAALLTFRWGHLFRMADTSKTGHVSRLRTRIGQCHDCASLGKPDPHSVSFRDGTMRFVVHRDFAAEFRQINQAETSTA